MKKFKILSLGVMLTLLFTSTTAMAKTDAHLISYTITGYSDSLHYSTKTNTYDDLFPVNADGSANDVFYPSDDTTAIVFLGKEAIGENSLGRVTYRFLDNNINTADSLSCNKDIYNKLQGLAPGSSILKEDSIDEFLNVPQGYHTINYIVSDDDQPMGGMYTPKVSLRVSKVTEYTLNNSMPVNTEFTFKMPKQVSPSVDLSNYVGVFDTKTGNQVPTSVRLASDNQTILIEPSTGRYSNNSNYELDILQGIKFVDNTESFEVTVINFSTNSTVEPTAGQDSFLKLAKQSINSINIDSKNPLLTKGIKQNSKSNFSKSLKYIRKFEQSLRK